MLPNQIRRYVALVATVAQRSPNQTVRTHSIGAGRLAELQSRGYVRFVGNDRWSITDAGQKLLTFPLPPKDAERAKAEPKPEPKAAP